LRNKLIKINTIVYLTYDGLTDPLGQSQVLPYLVGLSRKGWSISIVSFEKPDRFKANKNQIELICQKHGIEWIPLTYHKNPPVISTLLDLKTLRKTVSKLVQEKKPQVIHCRSYLPMLIALPYQTQGIKVLFDMRGFWPDERVEGNIWNLNNPFFKFIYRFFKKKEKVFLKKADVIVSLTQAAVPELKKLGAKNTICTIPTSTDLSLFEPSSISIEERNKMKEKLDLNDKFILGYAGSLGTWYLLDEMLLFFKSLKEKKLNAHFLIISKDDEEILTETTRKIAIDKTDYSLIKGERKEMPSLYSLFDCAIMFIKPSYSKTASSPTKLGELMAMGIPTICNSGIGDVDEIIDKYKAGMVLKDLTQQSLNRAVEEIMNQNYFNVNSMQQGAKDYYDLQKGVETYHEIYKKLSR